VTSGLVCFADVQIDVKMSIQYMSFSAHADAKGIMQLIRQCEPKNILLVHGEAAKMEFLRKKIEQEFGNLLSISSSIATLLQHRWITVCNCVSTFFGINTVYLVQ